MVQKYKIRKRFASFSLIFFVNFFILTFDGSDNGRENGSVDGSDVFSCLPVFIRLLGVLTGVMRLILQTMSNASTKAAALIIKSTK
jgi:hypothetical protein